MNTRVAATQLPAPPLPHPTEGLVGVAVIVVEALEHQRGQVAQVTPAVLLGWGRRQEQQSVQKPGARVTAQPHLYRAKQPLSARHILGLQTLPEQQVCVGTWRHDEYVRPTQHLSSLLEGKPFQPDLCMCTVKLPPLRLKTCSHVLHLIPGTFLAKLLSVDNRLRQGAGSKEPH